MASLVQARDRPHCVNPQDLGDSDRLHSEHRCHLGDRYVHQASHQAILLSIDTKTRAKSVRRLREQDLISREYLLEYDPKQRQANLIYGYLG